MLFEGDGSFQMTVQSVSDMAKLGLDLVVFLLDNEGYTIERWVHGMEEGYNDIRRWKWGEVVKGMCGEGARTWRVETRGELEGLWGNEGFAGGKGLRVSSYSPELEGGMTLISDSSRRLSCPRRMRRSHCSCSLLLLRRRTRADKIRAWDGCILAAQMIDLILASASAFVYWQFQTLEHKRNEKVWI